MSKSVLALDVANYIISIQGIESGLKISHLKLQKLTFYCQAFCLALHDYPMFHEDVEAWTYGPVVREVYDEYKNYGNSIISLHETLEHDADVPIDSDRLSVISMVLDAYGHLSAISLMERTHRETPWQDAFKKGNGSIIDQDVMKEYYKEFLV